MLLAMPNPAMHRTLRKMPRKVGDFERWVAQQHEWSLPR